MEKPTLDEIFDECLCMRELLIRLGFESKDITLAMPDNFKCISVALSTQGRTIAFEVEENHKPWTKKEVEEAWIRKVVRFMEGNPSNEGFLKIWRNSKVYAKAESIVIELLKIHITIPKLPPGLRPPDNTHWGQA